jgi:hypothetical protein
MNNPFGMDTVSPFQPPPPQMEQPDQGGKGGAGMAGDILSGVLSIGSMIPGPQQPFVLGAAALNGMAQGAIKGNPGQIVGGVTQLGGLGPLKDILGSAGKITSAAPTEMMDASTQWLSGVPGMSSSPSFGGYGYQYNPYQMIQPFGG